jgi:hypothetical protein
MDIWADERAKHFFFWYNQSGGRQTEGGAFMVWTYMDDNFEDYRLTIFLTIEALYDHYKKLYPGDNIPDVGSGYPNSKTRMK